MHRSLFALGAVFGFTVRHQHVDRAILHAEHAITWPFTTYWRLRARTTVRAVEAYVNHR